MDQSDICLLQNLKAAGSRTSALHEHFDLIQEAWEVFSLGSPSITKALQLKGIAEGASPSNVQAYIERQRKIGRLGKKGCRSGVTTTRETPSPPTKKTQKTTNPGNSTIAAGVMPAASANGEEAAAMLQAYEHLEKLFPDAEE